MPELERSNNMSSRIQERCLKHGEFAGGSVDGLAQLVTQGLWVMSSGGRERRVVGLGTRTENGELRVFSGKHKHALGEDKWCVCGAILPYFPPSCWTPAQGLCVQHMMHRKKLVTGALNG